MHDQTSTKGGQFGFSVLYEDDSELTEFDCTWDELPTDKRIKSLAIVDTLEGEILASLEGAESYYFANEAVAVNSMRFVPNAAGDGFVSAVLEPMLSAKIIGGIKDGESTEVRLDLLDSPGTKAERKFPSAEVRIVERARRPGVA